MLSLPGIAGATGSASIRTELCDSTSRPALWLASPLSDSVVNTQNVRLQGTAERTTQIDVFLNGAYSSSFAVGNNGQLDTTVALARGTNTIRLDAYYSCNQTSLSSTIILTYEPTVAPSSGPLTTTTLQGSSSSPQQAESTTTTPQPVPSSKPGSGSPRLPGITSPDTNESVLPSQLPGWITATIIASSLVAPSLFLLAVSKVAGIIGMTGFQLPTAVKWSVRGSGLILAGLIAALLYGAAGNV